MSKKCIFEESARILDAWRAQDGFPSRSLREQAAWLIAEIHNKARRADIIEMLLRGSKREGIPPGAIYKAAAAVAEQVEIHRRQAN